VLNHATGPVARVGSHHGTRIHTRWAAAFRSLCV
jgi:hypothetical protein